MNIMDFGHKSFVTHTTGLIERIKKTMELTSEQKREVEVFQQSLSREDEWFFYHLAWSAGDTDKITYEDKYEIMKKWDLYKS